MKQSLLISLGGLFVLLSACTGSNTTTPESPTSTSSLTQTQTPIPTPTPVLFTLMADVSPEGGGTVSTEEEMLEEGTEVNVYAEAAIGYAFDHWSGDDESKTYGITVHMDSDKAVTAHFVRVPSLVVSRTDIGIIDPSKTANALIDFDQDGDLDLVISAYNPNFPSPVLAFRNNGVGRFTNVTEEVLAGLPVEVTNATNYAVADFNNDGLDDLFIADAGDDYPGPITGGQSLILMQTETGQLIDETKTRLPQQKANTRNITIGDIDGDGDLDIYLCNLEHKIGPRFYINDGAGYFTEDEDRIPRMISNRMKEYISSLLVDIDNDEDLDLILGGYRGLYQDTILFNDGEGVFTEAPTYSLPTRLGGSSAQTIAIGAADFDKDGWQDLVMSTHVDRQYNPNLQLFFNNGDGTFRDETGRIEQAWDSYLVPDCGTGYQTYLTKLWIVDANNDGWPDILSQGAVCLMHVLFESSMGESFSIMDSYREYPALGGYGPLIPGDLDNDGIMDMILFYYGNHFQTLLRVLPPEPNAGVEPVTWNLPDEEPEPEPEVTCIDETALAEKSPDATTTFLYRDDFEGGLAPGWTWIREEPDQWNLTENPGYLQFNVEPSYYRRNLLLRPAPEGDFEISTRVLFKPLSNFQYAGLLIYQDEDNRLRFVRGFCFIEGNPGICPGNALYFDSTLKSEFSTCPGFSVVTASESEAYLKIRREGDLYSAYYSIDGLTWTMIGQHVMELDPIFIGLRAGGTSVSMTADFDYFLIESMP